MDTSPRTSGTLFGPEYSSADVVRLSGLTYRQLDYYDRIGVLRPSLSTAHGQGTRRLYSADDVTRTRLVSSLRCCGAPTDVIATALTQLPADPAEWPSFVFVEPNGRVRQYSPQSAAWWGVAVGRVRGWSDADLNAVPVVAESAA
jgi:DNA-binding transcriptional MerR regulator